MKKFAIAGAVLALAILVGYTGTTVALNNNTFLAQSLYPIKDLQQVNSKPEKCPNCATAQIALRDALEQLTSASQRTDFPNLQAFQRKMKELGQNVEKARKAVEECENKQKAYCEGYNDGQGKPGSSDKGTVLPPPPPPFTSWK